MKKDLEERKEVNLYMPISMYEKLKNIADSNSISCSAQARIIINNYIKEHEDSGKM